jgi:hypothetical protein
MVDQLVNGLEGHLATAIVISGVLALLIVAAVAFVWWRGRHWVDRAGASLASTRHTLLSQMDGPQDDRPAARGGGSGGGRRPTEDLGARLIREAAARAAGFRESWERSYREARGSAPGSAPGTSGSTADDLPTLIADVLREQRETNALLREVLQRLDQRE